MNIDADKKTSALLWTGRVLLALLFAVWPVAHTISLRDLLLVLTLALFGYLAWAARPMAGWRDLKWPAGLYLALTVWMVVVAFFISTETAWSLDEIRGQWLKGALALLLGGCTAYAFGRAGWLTRGLMVLFGVLLLHALYVDAVAIKGLVEAWFDPTRLTSLPRHVGIHPGSEEYGYLTLLRSYEWDQLMATDGPDKSNVLSNLLLYFLLAEILFRAGFRRRCLPYENNVLAAVLLAVVFSIYIERARNGILEIIFVLLLFGSLLFAVHRRRFSKRAVAVGLFLVLLIPTMTGYVSFKTDPRWQSLWQTVPIALDTRTHTAWLDLNSPLPRLPDGKLVNRSNYMRIARLKGGMELALERPWGVGYGRNAFGHAVMKKYGIAASHSHSGFVDMAIGIGLPGALLWVAFLVSLAVLGARGYRRHRHYPALLLLFVTTGYGVRMVLDSITRDHMLQMFLFLAAFLAVAAVRMPDDKTVPAA